MAIRNIPRIAKLVATWCIGYVSFGIFFPVLAAVAGVGAAYWIEVYTAVDNLPDRIEHTLDLALEEEDGRLHRWTDMASVEADVKGAMFSRMANAILKVDPTFWAKGAVDKYVSASGSNVACTLVNPGSLTQALTGACTGGVNPGDRIWARGGTYTTDASTHRWLVTTNGAVDPNNILGGQNWITLRNYQNEHVKLDCNADLTAANQNHICMGQNNNAGQYWTFWGLDFFNSSTESRYTGVVNGHLTTGNNGLTFMAPGALMINCFFRDMEIGILNNGHNGTAVVTPTIQHGGRGGYGQYNGYVGSDRGYGREWYFKGPDDVGEAGRQIWSDMMSLRAFSNGIQLYATDDTVSYITIKDMVIAASGHGTGSTWSAHGSGWPNFYLGSSGAGITSCHTTGSKVLYKMIFDNNWSVYGNSGTTFGASKGSCDSTITNNSFIYQNQDAMTWASPILGGSSGACHTGSPPVNYICGGTWGPVTLTGNTFYSALPSTAGTIGGCEDNNANCAATFTQANYPTNTYNSSFPASGYKFKYVVNADEAGRGRVYVMNWASTANVTIDPAQMGCYTGEQIRIFNHQDNNPWDSTPIATQTGCAPISISAMASTIYQPGFTMQDGTTPFAKPPDLGPEYVAFEMYPDWALASTPTPTNTASPTVTSSPTLTRTSSPTFTPTKTNTPSQTPTASVTPSQSPTSSPTFTVTQSATPTFTPSVVPSATPTPSGTFGSTSFDVQSCTLAAPMSNTTDATVYGGSYTSSSAGDTSNPIDGSSGTATCTFSVPFTGLYRTWIRANTPSSSQDSMYVSIDGEAVSTTAHVFDIGESSTCPNEDPPDEYGNIWTKGWNWVKLNDRSQNCKGATSPVGYERAATGGDSTTVGISLTAGQHTMTFTSREAGAQIDYVIITNDYGFVPNDFSLTPTPTPAPFRHPHICNGKMGWHSHSYSGAHRHVPCPWN